MVELFTYMIDMLVPFSPMLMPLFVGSVAYTTWYFVARRYIPMTRMEAEILWKIHRQEAKCNAKKWQAVHRGKKIIGFECKCGYKHLQKRPMF